jgi:hypothetical protein
MTLGRAASIGTQAGQLGRGPERSRSAATMTRGANPFDSNAGDPFTGPSATPGTGFTPSASGGWPFGSSQPQLPQQPRYNTCAVLAPIFAVLVPPAGVVLAHLAMPQIRRSGERGRWAAIWGMIVGYVLCVALIAGAAVWATSGGSTSAPASSNAAGTGTAGPIQPIPPSVITSVAPAPTSPRAKLDLAQVAVGTCVEIQLRGGQSDDALDLFGVPCEHREGVYTVVARASTDADCRSTYVTAPPDHSFALCLNRY